MSINFQQRRGCGMESMGSVNIPMTNDDDAGIRRNIS